MKTRTRQNGENKSKGLAGGAFNKEIRGGNESPGNSHLCESGWMELNAAPSIEEATQFHPIAGTMVGTGREPGIEAITPHPTYSNPLGACTCPSPTLVIKGAGNDPQKCQQFNQEKWGENATEIHNKCRQHSRGFGVSIAIKNPC